VIRGTKVINTIDVSSNPTTIEPVAVGVDPTRHLAYVLDDGGISILHGSTLQTTVANNPVLELPDTIAVDPVSHLAYIGTTYRSGSVSILEGATVKKTVQIGEVAGLPVFDPSNGLVIFPAGLAPQITVFDGLTDVQSLTPTPTVFEAAANVDTSNGHVYVSGYSTDADTFTELQAPTADTLTITRPTHRHYARGAKVRVTFSCSPGTHNVVLSCVGSTANGHLLPTTKLGSHRFTVRLASRYGPTTTKTVTYVVRK
jgi:hypothetical protein